MKPYSEPLNRNVSLKQSYKWQPALRHKHMNHARRSSMARSDAQSWIRGVWDGDHWGTNPGTRLRLSNWPLHHACQSRDPKELEHDTSPMDCLLEFQDMHVKIWRGSFFSLQHHCSTFEHCQCSRLSFHDLADAPDQPAGLLSSRNGLSFVCSGRRTYSSA